MLVTFLSKNFYLTSGEILLLTVNSTYQNVYATKPVYFTTEQAHHCLEAPQLRVHYLQAFSESAILSWTFLQGWNFIHKAPDQEQSMFLKKWYF